MAFSVLARKRDATRLSARVHRIFTATLASTITTSLAISLIVAPSAQATDELPFDPTLHSIDDSSSIWVVVNKDRQIAEAKKHALLMAEAGYTQPIQRTDVKVLGKQALGMFLVGTDQMVAGKYISEHDQKIANKLAYVMAGGDLSEPTLVSEQYLLDIEREAFLSLCTERKTLERIQFMLTKGKPLRN